ncbi:uncharacterized protein LOC111872578 isoform X8 [Cryptotermes secundus]|nr:uncharacterized protein LOC111872578 isoform X8 [Cryptotermes secundus]
MDVVYEGQHDNKTEWMSSQNDVQLTPTKEDLSDSLVPVVKQEENVEAVTPETESDSEAKLMSSVNGDPFVDVKQEEKSEPFSFVSVKEELLCNGSEVVKFEMGPDPPADRFRDSLFAENRLLICKNLA